MSLPYKCPTCGGDLEESRQSLGCGRGHSFPLVRGIPRFAGSAEYVGSFGLQWNRWSTTQIDSRNGTRLFRDRFSRYIAPPEELAGLRVLDAGCGPGGFVDVVAPYAGEVAAFDLSTAIDAAAVNTRDFPNVRVSQADIFHPPFERASFDLVYCIGVLQHTPDPRRAFESLASLVAVGGRLGVWVYERAPWEYLKPRHYVRQIFRRVPERRQMGAIERYAPRALRARHRLKTLPGGRLLSKLVPVADVYDYAGQIPDHLSAAQIAEWTVMDTHDMLITHFDSPQRPRDLAAWFAQAGFVDVHRRPSESIAMVGTKAA